MSRCDNLVKVKFEFSNATFELPNHVFTQWEKYAPPKIGGVQKLEINFIKHMVTH